MSRIAGMERRIWHPEENRWIIIDRDGSLIDVQRTGSGRLSFHASSNDFDPREIENWLRQNRYLPPA